MNGTSRDSFTCLSVGIVGAGIAGLSAAIALAKAGHQVEVFEKSSFANEVGAAINVCPNATRILTRWGFDFERWEPFEAQMANVFDAKTLKQVANLSYKNFEKLFGSKYYLYHRVDLHSGLKAKALESTQSGGRVKFRLASEVADINCEKGTLTMKDGSNYHKDLLVIADGVHSNFVKYINGKNARAEPTGMCAFRWLIPKAKLLENPPTKEFLDATSPGINIATSINHTRLVWYPCRRGNLYNFVGIHPEKPGRRQEDDWTSAGSLDDLLATYQPFGERILEVCRQAEDLKLWTLFFRAPLDTWILGKAVLIGDAAHPMLPHQGQGGAQALEDGAALGTIFSHVQSEADVPKMLRVFEDVRKNRASAMQYLSNAGQDEAKTVERMVQPYVTGPVPKTYDEIHQFNFGHDVVLESQRALIAAGMN